jgi:hypothetical protein
MILKHQLDMKKFLFFATAAILLSACSNSGSKTQPSEQTSPNEVVITNDMENAMGLIPSWFHERTVMQLKDIPAHSGTFVAVTSDTIEYSYSYSDQFKNINSALPKSAIVTGWIYTTEPKPLFSIVLDTKQSDSLIEWKAVPLTETLTEKGQWIEFNADFYFGKPLNPEQKVSIYAWNQSKKPIYIDDLKIIFNY